MYRHIFLRYLRNIFLTELLDNEANNAQGINNLLLLENDGGQAMPCCVCIHSGVGKLLIMLSTERPLLLNSCELGIVLPN